MSKTDLVSILDLAIQRARLLPREWGGEWFRISGPMYFRGRGEGFAFSSGGQQIGFDPTAEGLLEQMVRELVSGDPIKKVAGEDFVREIVIEVAGVAAAKRLAGKQIDVAAEFSAIKKEILSHKPSLIVFPIRDLHYEGRVRSIGPLVIGHVGESLEKILDRQLKEAGVSRGFRFDDSVNWTESYLNQEYVPEYTNEPGRRRRRRGQLVVAMRTPLRGSLAVADAFTKLEILFGVLNFLAKSAGVQHYRVPRIGDERQAYEVQNGYFEESAQVLHLDPHTKGSQLDIVHGWEILELEHLVRGRAALKLLRVMLGVEDGGVGREVANRFVRFIHWSLHAGRAESFVDRLVFSVSSIEALLGSGDKATPIVSLVAERMALLLPARRGDERLKVARDMRKLYDYRSGLVHGSLPVTAHSSAELYKAANEAEGLAVRTAKEFWARGQVARWKSNDEIRDWFERRKYRIGIE